MTVAALGFSDHSGWAVMVVVSRERDGGFRLVSRDRIATRPDRLPRQPFHAVAEAGYRQDVITEVYGQAHELALQAIRAAVARVPVAVAAVGVGRLGRLATPPELPRILASHALLHSAEGELYRDALSDAAEHAGLRVVRFFHKEVRSEAAAALSWPPARLEESLSQMGKTAGRPWTKDEKDAAAAAMLALATVAS